MRGRAGSDSKISQPKERKKQSKLVVAENRLKLVALDEESVPPQPKGREGKRKLAAMDAEYVPPSAKRRAR